MWWGIWVCKVTYVYITSISLNVPDIDMHGSDRGQKDFFSVFDCFWKIHLWLLLPACPHGLLAAHTIIVLNIQYLTSLARHGCIMPRKDLLQCRYWCWYYGEIAQWMVYLWKINSESIYFILSLAHVVAIAAIWQQKQITGNKVQEWESTWWSNLTLLVILIDCLTELITSSLFYLSLAVLLMRPTHLLAGK